MKTLQWRCLNENSSICKNKQWNKVYDKGQYYPNAVEAVNRNWLLNVCSTSRAKKGTKENWQKTDAKPTQGGGFHITYGHVLDSNILHVCKLTRQNHRIKIHNFFLVCKRRICPQTGQRLGEYIWENSYVVTLLLYVSAGSSL